MVKRAVESAVLLLVVMIALACASRRSLTGAGPGGGALVFRAALEGSGESGRGSGGVEPVRDSTRGVIRYLRERGLDFLDIVKLQVGIGLVVHADVEATILAHFGVGMGRSPQVWSLSHPLDLRGRLGEPIDGFPLSNVRGADSGWWGALVCHSHVYGSPQRAWEKRSCLFPLLLTIGEDGTFGPPSAERFPPLRWLDVEAGATAFPASVRVGVSPGELADFLVGWFGLDLPGADDQWRWADRMD